MWYSARILGRDHHLPMTSRRYSLIIANRDTGLMRRLTLRVDALVCVALVALVAGGALGIRSLVMSAAGFDDLKFENARLALENDSYDVAADELSGEMATLGHTIAELAARADLDPSIVESMEKLPHSGRARAVVDTDGSTPPLHTFARLQSLLVSLGDELGRVRRGVAYREALAAATPVIWPADGWISGGYGYPRGSVHRRARLSSRRPTSPRQRGSPFTRQPPVVCCQPRGMARTESSLRSTMDSA